jgi:hypothetical protein
MLLDFSESCRRCQRAPVSHADTHLVYSASENSAGLMGSRRVRRHPHHRD